MRKRSRTMSLRRRRGAAVQIMLGGLLLLSLPALLGKGTASAGFAALAPVGWLMLVGGVAVLWALRQPTPVPQSVDIWPRQAVPDKPWVDAPPPARRLAVDIDLTSLERQAGIEAWTPATRTWHPSARHRRSPEFDQ